MLSEKKEKGIIAYRDIFPAVMHLMTKGYFPADKLVTKRITLDEVVKEGFETLVNDTDQIKILFQNRRKTTYPYFSISRFLIAQLVSVLSLECPRYFHFLNRHVVQGFDL